MDERIKELGRQAGFAFIEDGVYGQRWYSSKCGMDADEFEKFAELIVRECIVDFYRRYLDVNSNEDITVQVERYVKEHFGVKE